MFSWLKKLAAKARPAEQAPENSTATEVRARLLSSKPRQMVRVTLAELQEVLQRPLPTDLRTAPNPSSATTPQIPEKYQVKKEDGTLDVEASLLKLAEAYGNLEKRIGTGDIPPKSAGDYEIAVPDMFKDAIDPKTDPMMQDFITKAHRAAGFTQTQMDLAMGEYFAIAPQLVAGSVQLSAED